MNQIRKRWRDLQMFASEIDREDSQAHKSLLRREI